MHSSGVTAGLERFIAERGVGLLRAATILTGDEHHAQDLLQTALAKSWKRYSELDSDNKFEAYLRTTMYRTFISWWRRMSWRSELATAEPGDQTSATEQSATSATRVDLLRALEQLPRMQRAVLVLRFLEDRPIKEVAVVLGIGEGTVKKYAHRGCAALRESVHLDQEEMSHE